VKEEEIVQLSPAIGNA